MCRDDSEPPRRATAETRHAVETQQNWFQTATEERPNRGHIVINRVPNGGPG
jgi:hypothetical protein